MSTVENDVASTLCAIQNRDFTWFDTSLDNIAKHTSHDTLDCLHYSIFKMLNIMSGGARIQDVQLQSLAQELAGDLNGWEPTITADSVYQILTSCLTRTSDNVSLDPIEHFVVAAGVSSELLPESPHAIIEILVERHKR